MKNTRLLKGMGVMRQLYPNTVSELIDNLNELSPELAKLTIEYGFGEVMSRKTLDLPTRELLNIAMLGAMGNAPLQLEMHILGALNTGATEEQIIEVILQISVYAGFPSAYNTLLAAKKIFEIRQNTN